MMYSESFRIGNAVTGPAMLVRFFSKMNPAHERTDIPDPAGLVRIVEEHAGLVGFRLIIPRRYSAEIPFIVKLDKSQLSGDLLIIDFDSVRCAMHGDKAGLLVGARDRLEAASCAALTADARTESVFLIELHLIFYRLIDDIVKFQGSFFTVIQILLRPEPELRPYFCGGKIMLHKKKISV
jgi:hypothetical protein